MQELTSNFNESIVEFNSELALRYIKQMIKTWKIQKDEEDDDDFLRALFQR
jgi:hypothetical protein